MVEKEGGSYCLGQISLCIIKARTAIICGQSETRNPQVY